MKRPKNPIRLVLWFGLLILLLYLIGYAYFNHLLSASNPSDQAKKIFVVNKGEDLPEISKRLEKQGLIRSAWAFDRMAKNSEYTSRIQTGDFSLSPAMSAEEILKQLATGVVDIWVTLLEGWRNEEMAAKLSKALGVKSDEFLEAAKGKQGYLFPDTYLFNPDVTTPDIVGVLQNNFDKKYTSDLQAKIRSKGLTADQGVILASIVEREARSDEVRKNVAGILLKRFKIGMALNADATIQYALGYQTNEKSWWKRRLSLDDLKINSPYNTYIHAGLPPTPISNPSLSSLKAVADADPTTAYLYYYHDSQGNSYYSKTLEEHNASVTAHP